MILAYFFILIGLVALFFGGEFLLKGTLAISTRLRVCKVLMSAVIAGFATSTPELVVSINAAIQGSPDVVLGNILGSNSANILLISGVGWVLYPFVANVKTIQRDVIFQEAFVIVFLIMSFFKIITVWSALCFLIMLTGYLWMTYKSARRETEINHEGASGSLLNNHEHTDTTSTPPSYTRSIMFVVLGLILLTGGGHVLIIYAVDIARTYHISEAAIGLTLVAVGTSLPELATTVVACLRKEPSMILGNILGSNIFNIGAILGLTALFYELPIAQSILTIDRWILLVATAAFTCVLYFVRNPLRMRFIGLGFLSFYTIYMISTLRA
jgi:cation:H+ antiporter